jgi:hypothetical protein
LLEGLAARRSVEATQAKRIIELEEARANLKLTKGIVTTSYRRLTNKYKRLEEKPNALEREKTDAVEVVTPRFQEMKRSLCTFAQDVQITRTVNRYNISINYKL